MQHIDILCVSSMAVYMTPSVISSAFVRCSCQMNMIYFYRMFFNEIYCIGNQVCIIFVSQQNLYTSRVLRSDSERRPTGEVFSVRCNGAPLQIRHVQREQAVSRIIRCSSQVPRTVSRDIQQYPASLDPYVPVCLPVLIGNCQSHGH